jgi:hypothetical protein
MVAFRAMLPRDREKLFRVLLLAICLAAGAVRLFSLPAFPSDIDEAFQLRAITAPRAEFWRLLKLDAVHPPLDYLVDRALERIVPGCATRRFAPIAFGALAVGAFGLLMRRRGSAVLGLTAAGLLAFALYHVSECRRLRPYSLAVLLFCATLVLLDRYLDRPTATRLSGFLLFGIATAYTLYLAALVLVPAAAALALDDAFSRDHNRRRNSRRLLRWSPALAAAGLVGLAPLLPLIRKAGQQHAPVAAAAITASRFGRILSYCAFSPNAGYGFSPRWIFLAGFSLALCLFLLGSLSALRRPGLRFLLGWAAAGLVCVEAFKKLFPHWDSFRYFLPVALALTALEALALATLLEKKRLRPLGLVLAGGVLFFGGVSLARYYRFGAWRFSSGKTITTSSALTRPSFSRAFFSSSNVFAPESRMRASSNAFSFSSCAISARSKRESS